ncbi:MAG TPA: hypothetical protein VLT90_13185 [Terriglobales bacterium]|nr:hypothetical protein [Terriglobales bacterium]
MSEVTRVLGPLFDGRAQAQIPLLMAEAVHQAARVGEQDVHIAQAAKFVNPTGRYESSIRIEGSGITEQITDGGMIYGPWLEGVGSRNKTTRFKGYKIMRSVTQGLKREKVKVILGILVPKHVARMNE